MSLLAQVQKQQGQVDHSEAALLRQGRRGTAEILFERRTAREKQRHRRGQQQLAAAAGAPPAKPKKAARRKSPDPIDFAKLARSAGLRSLSR